VVDSALAETGKPAAAAASEEPRIDSPVVLRPKVLMTPEKRAHRRSSSMPTFTKGNFDPDVAFGPQSSKEAPAKTSIPGEVFGERTISDKYGSLTTMKGKARKPSTWESRREEEQRETEHTRSRSLTAQSSGFLRMMNNKRADSRSMSVEQVRPRKASFTESPVQISKYVFPLALVFARVPIIEITSFSLSGPNSMERGRSTTT